MRISGKIILLTLSLLLGSNLVFSQVKLRDIGNREIVGLNLDAETREQLKSVRTQSFTIDNQGVLRPAKGYNIYHFSDRKVVVITSKTKKEFLQAAREGQVTISGNVTLRCSSYDDECELCMVDLVNGEYYCKAGNCKDCNMDAVIAEGKVASAAVKQ